MNQSIPPTSSPEIPPEQIIPSLFRSNMLRMILTKHIELVKMADNKASILMTAASIVIAMTVASGQDERSVGPLIVVVTAMLAIIFAILVIYPKPYLRKEDSINMMYFRSFGALSEDEYVRQFMELMKDKNALYEQYMRDIYRYANITLKKKYQWLSLGLSSFLLGLIVGGIYFILSFI